VRPNTTNPAQPGSDDILTDRKLFRNWAIDILPYLEEQSTSDAFNVSFTSPVNQPVNSNARGVEIPVMLCPSDNGRGQKFEGSRGNWARGNYGYNALQFWPNSYVWWGLLSDRNIIPYYQMSMGVGGMEDGVNRQVLSIKKISDGTTKTVLLAEMRVGLSERDRRGVWAMGMCGSNMHCRHAATSINSCAEDDDLFGDADVIADVGESSLLTQCMMPAKGLNLSGQTIVRSRHAGGAMIALCDASVRFVSDFIDQGNIRIAGYVGDKRPDDLKPENFRIWQRLLVSRDSFDVSGDF
jgi:hypothetical protein